MFNSLFKKNCAVLR